MTNPSDIDVDAQLLYAEWYLSSPARRMQEPEPKELIGGMAEALRALRDENARLTAERDRLIGEVRNWKEQAQYRG